MRRKVTPELLDTDDGTPQEVAASLADLRHINRLFGGTSTSIDLLRRFALRAHTRHISILDVGSGAGDVPMAAQDALRREGVDSTLTLLDSNASHLPSQMQTVVGDALAPPFANNQFDVVTSSLFVHHLEPDDVRRFVQSSLRVARQAVIINDLVRSLPHLLLVYAGMPMFRSRITRHDSVASVRRAYTVGELNEILSGLGSCIEFSTHYLYRVGVIIWK